MTKTSPLAYVVAAFAGLFFLNYAIVWAGFRPLVYCGFRDIAWELWQPMQVLILLCGVLFFIWSVATARYGRAVLAFRLGVIGYSLPDWGRTLFALGKECI